MSRDREREERDEALRRAVHDTPSRPLSPLDVRLARFNAELPSLPPPPPSLEEQRVSTLSKIRDRAGSGSWDVERLMGNQLAFYQGALERAILEERLGHAKEKAEETKAALADSRKLMASLFVGIVVTVVGGGTLAALCWAVAELVRHAGR